MGFRSKDGVRNRSYRFGEKFRYFFRESKVLGGFGDEVREIEVVWLEFWVFFLRR